MEEKFDAQGIIDIFKFMDEEVVEKISSIVKTLDPLKIKKICDAIDVDDDGFIKVKVDLKMFLF